MYMPADTGNPDSFRRSHWVNCSASSFFSVRTSTPDRLKMRRTAFCRQMRERHEPVVLVGFLFVEADVRIREHVDPVRIRLATTALETSAGGTVIVNVSVG